MDRKTLLCGAATLLAAPTLAQKKPMPKPRPLPAGIYAGALDTGAVKLRIVLRLKPNGASMGGTLDSIDQGANGIPISGGGWKDDRLFIEVKALGGSWLGEVSKDGKTLTGVWGQGGSSLVLNLTRTEAAPTLRRPQTPKPPFPYRTVDVSVPNDAAAGVTLAGTLTLPNGDGPFPTVVFITGSGPQNRDEELFVHKPFAVLADALARRGIASLRCDDRGVGKSTGNFPAATSADFATDVVAQIGFLRTRKEIDASRLGLIGHSEGGLIAPMVAAADSAIAYIVLLAGPGVSGEEVLKLQRRLLLKASGLSDSAVEAAAGSADRMVAKAMAASTTEEARKVVVEAIRAENPLVPLKDAEAGAAQLVTPWMRYFLSYDPIPALRKVACPVLAINGGKDLQVDPKQNLGPIEAALKAGGNTQVTTKVLPGLNHLFQHATTGAVNEYGQIEETLAPEAIQIVCDWIHARTKP